MLRWALSIWFADRMHDSFVRECDGDTFETVDCDQGWRYFFEMLQSSAHDRFGPFNTKLEL